MTENAIEFITHDDTATVTFSQKKYIRRIINLAEKHEEVKILEYPENNDGYLLAHIPSSWIKINPKVKLSEEERNRRVERIKAARGNKNIVNAEKGEKNE